MHAQGLEKIRFIISMLEAGMQPMFSDLDVVWLKNPLPYVRQLQEPNVLVSSDSCNVQQTAPLDNCTAIMGSNKRVEGKGTFVGTMNVRFLPALSFCSAFEKIREKTISR